MASMKKIFYYNFIPTKLEELAALSQNRPYQVTRTLIEIRDNNPPTNVIDPSNPWRITKRLETGYEIANGKIHLSHNEVFEHIFRYISLEQAKYIVNGNRIFTKVFDMTDDNPEKHRMYGPYDEQVYFEKVTSKDEYVLGINMNIIQQHNLSEGDCIAIFYDARADVFWIKIFK